MSIQKGKYAIICRFKYAEICMKYAAICTIMQYTICRNMHKQANKRYAIYVHNKHKYAKICKNKICTYTQKYHMHKYAQNMHKYANPNMHKYAFSKYALKCVLYA